LRRAFVRRSRCGVTVSRGRATGRLFQIGRHPFVRAGGRDGEVPGAPVDVTVSGIGRGQRAVGGDPLTDGRTLIDRRPHQGMPEDERAGGQRNESSFLGWLEVVDAETQFTGRAQQHRHLAGVVRGGEQKERASGRRQGPDLVMEGVEDPAGQRHGTQLGAGDQRRQLP
jgi:hypothetical protein